MPKKLNQRAVRRYFRRKIAKLTQLACLAEGSATVSDKLDRELAAFLSELFDDFGFSVSSPEFSGLVASEGNVASLNDLYRKAYGASAARVGLGGSSTSNLAILGVLVRLICPDRSLVLCDSQSHKSAIGGLIISGHKTVFLSRKTSEKVGVASGISADDIKALLDKHEGEVAAVFITDPTYEGFGSDLETIHRLCRRYGVLLIVDGAWASQFGLSSEFPCSPIHNADIVIKSVHKSGLAPCQVSVVLFQDVKHAEKYDRVAELGFATTSPNQLVLQIAEHRICEVLETDEPSGWEIPCEVAAELANRVQEIHPDLSIVRAVDLGAKRSNPVHLLIDAAPLPIDARRWAEALRRNFGVDVELATQRHLLMIFGRGVSKDVTKLIARLRAALIETLGSPSDVGSFQRPPIDGTSVTTEPVDMRKAFFASRQTKALNRSAGRRASSLVTSYPPGRAILVPGQPIAPLQIEQLESAIHAGEIITGLTFDDKRANVELVGVEQKRRRLGSQLDLGSYSIETLVASSLDDALMAEYANLFRETFCHWPFNQFAFNEAAPLTPIAPSIFLEGRAADKSDYYTLSELDSVNLPAGVHLWTDPATCREQLDRRCQSDGYVTILREMATGDIVGLLHGRATTLRELFASEEWSDPLLFSAYDSSEFQACPKTFFEKSRFHFGMEPDDGVFSISTMAIHPSHRGKQNLIFEMMAAMANVISDEHAALPMLAEIPDTGPARLIDMAVNERMVHGILENGHDVVFTSPMSNAMQHFQLGLNHFKSRLKAEIVARKKVFVAHRDDNPNVEVRKTEKLGWGVFATRTIEAGETIATFSGEKYHATSATALPSTMVDHAIQIGPQDFVHGRRGLAELCNHSCNPNAGVRNLTQIFAARRIETGEEVCWDYRCSEDSDWVLRDCQCGSEECTREVKGFNSLSESKKMEYIHNGLVSEWILKHLDDSYDCLSEKT